jgi:hypothetical protein
VIEFAFTIDYEIYGNGTGDLRELVYDPGRRLKQLFDRHKAQLVVFVEVAELLKIEQYGTDTAIDLVKNQIQEFHRDGFEVALHLHPQWANARYEGGRWLLDLAEYNLCILPKSRIAEIVDEALCYLRFVLKDSGYTPLSFRAGNWLFQPTATAAGVLADRGIRIDSSVFKGGLQRNHRLDYRPAAVNGYYWPFSADVNTPDPSGSWIEVPIHTEMVHLWKMPTAKRMKSPNQFGVARSSWRQTLTRASDFMRFLYPVKLDFCRMTLQELTSTVDRVICEDRRDPDSYRPIVSIGHTKDLTDLQTVDSFLSFLAAKRIPVCTFPQISSRLVKPTAEPAKRRA